MVIMGRGDEVESRPMDRRTVLKAVAWSAPAVVVATSAPAFASSNPTEPTLPEVTGCRRPGEGKNKKDYYLRFPVEPDDDVLLVLIDNRVALEKEHGWHVSRTDSRVDLPVHVITMKHEWNLMVRFPICKHESEW